MTQSERDSLAAAVEALQSYADRQAELAKGVVRLFMDLTVAFGPVLVACQDRAVVAVAMAEIERINAELVEMAERGGLAS